MDVAVYSQAFSGRSELLAFILDLFCSGFFSNFVPTINLIDILFSPHPFDDLYGQIICKGG